MTEARYVNVKFDNNRYSSKYTYKIPDRLIGQINVGDLLLVPNTNSAFGYGIVKVDSLTLTTSISPLKEVVTIVDDKDYRREIVNRHKRESLEKKLKERHKKLMESEWLEDLKRRDPESLNLIRELEALS